MTLFQFNQLAEYEQAAKIKKHGVLIIVRSEGEVKVFLYQVDSFYIELFHNVMKGTNSSLRILKAFTDISHLDCYLTRIDISFLLQGAI